MPIITNNAQKRRILKSLLYIYIALCLLFASLNYALAPRVHKEMQQLITSVWHFYENGLKVILIIVASLLTISIVKSQKEYGLRKRNLIALTISALVLHIILPFLLNNQEIYFFSMPLPWSTMPLQFFAQEGDYYYKSVEILSLKGITLSLIFFIAISFVIVIGTLIQGRRWQCSSLCMFNGFAGEIFSCASPSKEKKKRGLFLKKFRSAYLIVALLFISYWVLLLFKIPLSAYSNVVASIEVAKYLTFELFFMMICWVVISPRGYCYVCPVGNTLSLLSKVVKMRIVTDVTSCISCNKCNDVCPMNIDISTQAKKGFDVIDSLCVGCGHCVDVCPQKTLRYTTNVLEAIRGEN